MGIKGALLKEWKSSLRTLGEDLRLEATEPGDDFLRAQMRERAELAQKPVF